MTSTNTSSISESGAASTPSALLARLREHRTLGGSPEGELEWLVARGDVRSFHVGDAKPVGAGTGLGLDIARRLVSGQGGSIEVTSAPGRTEFCVKLPVAKTSGRAADNEAQASEVRA